ncbi:outer membrane beta-barrel protein [Vibrio sp. 10N.261.51.F12]|uniref:outer membrane beta-barrel protein n=1 Tax=Vibrio sp. 10N.261.51.F12 TaxID=3229679 RepID=UPI003550C7C9
MKLLKFGLGLSLLLTSATSSADSFQFLVGVDTGKSFAGGIEGTIYDNYIIGAQANLDSTDSYNSGPYSHSTISDATYTQKRSAQHYALYTGYRFTKSAVEGLAIKVGVTQMRLTMSADVYGTESGDAASEELYKINESKLLPFIGVGYQIAERLTLNVHASFGGLETITVDGQQEPTGIDATNVSFLVGFRF